MLTVTAPGPRTRDPGFAIRGFRRRCATFARLGTLTFLAGCGTAGPVPVVLQGASSGVTWEITDVGQLVSQDKQRMRWSYVILLRETTGSAVVFEQVERAIRSDIEIVGGGPRTWPFPHTLAAHGELRYATWESWGWTPESGRSFQGAATISPLTVEHRFVGRSSGGQPVAVTARIRLDRSVGRVVTPTLLTSGPLPPSTTLQESDLARLAGRWRGSFRADGDVFDVPVEFLIAADGSVEVATNEPVTSRFRATVSIREGQLAYTGTPVVGNFRLHEGEGRRILAGYLSAPRQGTQPLIGYTFRLRPQGL